MKQLNEHWWNNIININEETKKKGKKETDPIRGKVKESKLLDIYKLNIFLYYRL